MPPRMLTPSKIEQRMAHVARVLDECRHLHFVGVGGAGMSPLAELCLARSIGVTGSDVEAAAAVDTLRELGARVSVGHAPEHLGAATALVRSTAIGDDNPEVVEARRRNIPILARAELLSWLMRGQIGIGCGGTHGKTSSTAILGAIAAYLGWEPTVVVGGRPLSQSSNVRIGQGRHVIVEADESDGSFLLLPCRMVLVTSIDDDHLEYYGSIEQLETHMVQFINGVGPQGMAVLCRDDERIRALLPRVTVPTVTYGESPLAEYRVSKVAVSGRNTSFSLSIPSGEVLDELTIAAPGAHYAANAAGCLALAHCLGAPLTDLAAGLRAYPGVARRFEYKGCERGITVIDDYGHHPTEVVAVLKAARQAYPHGRVVTVFQPHRGSRTKLLAAALGESFSRSELVVLLPVYRPAGELDDEPVTAELVYRALEDNHPFVVYIDEVDFQKALPIIVGQLQSGDCVITLGAGTVTELGTLLLDYLKRGRERS